MKFKTSFFTRLYQLFLGYTLLVYALVYFAFSGHWIVGFLMITFPVVLLIHFLFCLFWLFFKPRNALLPALGVLLSFPFWPRSFGWHSAPIETDKEISVLSYNVMSFDVGGYLNQKELSNARTLIDWTRSKEADIKCLQEFYNNSKSEYFNTLNQFKARNHPYNASLYGSPNQNEHNYFGLVILSKYPIVKSKSQVFDNQNGMVYADIKIEKDTIRVINVHLRSMIVRFGGIKEAYKGKDYQQGKSETRKVLGKLKRGFIHHEKEVEQLMEWINQSPHPVMVCGDFNETPYNYAYGQVRKRLSNAFEEAGRGFGFSYKNAPKFIRIDNQFFDPKKLEALDFQTLSEVKYSDHYPIVGRYKLL